MFVAAAAGVVFAALAVPSTSSFATDFGPPEAPTGVVSRVVEGGVRVTWTPPGAADPSVTHYVVHAGPGSCPVSVGAKTRTAVMPVVKGQKVIRPQVQAVNELGYSAGGTSADSVNVRGRASGDFVNLQVLQFSDFHGALESSATNIGAATLVSAFERDRAAVPNTITVSAGDNFGGSPAISAQFEELPSVQVLNAMGLDVSTTGNHEHDRPLSHLRSMVQASDFAWVVSNYSTLAPLRTGKEKVDEFTIVDADGVQVGIVGMNTEDTAEVTAPGNLNFGASGTKAIEISPKTSEVNKRVKAARKAGADVVIALLHQGWQTNAGEQPVGRLIDVTRALRGVDLSYGGHTHQTFASIVNNVPVAQTLNAGQEYTRSQVCVDKRTGTVVGVASEHVTKQMVALLEPDARTQALVDRYADELSARLDRVIGVVDGVFPRGGVPPVERSGESALGSYYADALREKYQTDIAFISGGGLRDTFPAGGYTPKDPSLRRPGPGSTGPYDVTLGDVVAVLPFNNYTATSTITGADLWAALENGVSGYPSDGRFPQISGFRFTFDPSRPVGQRIVSVTLDDGRSVPRDGTVYTVSTIDFLVNGGDDYRGYFSPATAVMRDVYTDVLTEKVIADTAKFGRVPVTSGDGRITKVG